jgi:hypothetical protein
MFPRSSLQLWVEVPVIVVIGIILTIMAGKMGKLGPQLFRRPRPLHWLVCFYAFFAALEIWFYATGDPLWSCVLSLAFFGVLSVFEFSDLGFVLHENGIRWAQAVVYWSEIEAWAWIGNEETLRLWTRTWTCRVNTFGFSDVVDTGLQRTQEVDALLARYVGDRRRLLP